MKALVIHGPNLNLLGTREPEIYGTGTLEEIDIQILKAADELGFEVDIQQTAREGEIIELLHDGIERIDGAIVNPGAYAHTSRAIADAFGAVPYPVIEVHLTNIHARESWRRQSVTAESAFGIIAGFGVDSYLAGLLVLKGILSG